MRHFGCKTRCGQQQRLIKLENAKNSQLHFVALNESLSNHVLFIHREVRPTLFNLCIPSLRILSSFHCKMNFLKSPLHSMDLRNSLWLRQQCSCSPSSHGECLQHLDTEDISKPKRKQKHCARTDPVLLHPFLVAT